MDKTSSICAVAGHSGGHIIPTITKALEYKHNNFARRIIFFSTSTTLDQAIIKNFSIDQLIQLRIENLPSLKKIYRLPLFTFFFLSSFLKSLLHLYRTQPSRIIATGGYVAIPVCLAGALLRIPIELYELNVEPGKAITFLARFAQKICITFKKTADYFPSKQCTVTKYPIRFTQEDLQINRLDLLQRHDFSADKKTVFILGGSQGSLFLNKQVKSWIEHNPEIKNKIQIIHQVGVHEKDNWQIFYKELGIPHITFDYLNNLAPMYHMADIVICRAGAGTLAELLFFNKKAIIIPLEIASTSHQLLNAQEMAHEHPDLFNVVRQHEIEKSSASFHKCLREYLHN
jgi:UDP-N-acetylglucosamine--N-acetylmuramyl-(pentapeptide) pyrophosphoryl-undecaprenol N-acetylglucosamine transferase